MFKFFSIQIKLGKIDNQGFLDFQLSKKRITEEEYVILTEQLEKKNK